MLTKLLPPIIRVRTVSNIIIKTEKRFVENIGNCKHFHILLLSTSRSVILLFCRRGISGDEMEQDLLLIKFPLSRLNFID